MGIDLGSIKDIRLRQRLEAQLMSTPPPARPQLTPLDSGKPGEGVERDLHDEIIALCRSRGWYYIHSRMDRASTVAVGAPDFVIALPGGRTVWLECKRKGSKPTPAQNAAISHLKHLDHTCLVVFSIEEAKAVLETMPKYLKP